MTIIYFTFIAFTIGLGVWAISRFRNEKRVSPRVWILLLAAVITVVIVQMTYFKQPPLSVTHRPSSVGKGYVLRVTNTGKVSLHNVLVQGLPANKAAVVSRRIDPGETVEVGWLELPFTVTEGFYIFVADGYRGSVSHDIKPITALVKDIKKSVKDGL